MPREIRVSSHRPAEGAQVTLLGHNAPLPWRPDGDGFVVTIPDASEGESPRAATPGRLRSTGWNRPAPPVASSRALSLK